MPDEHIKHIEQKKDTESTSRYVLNRIIIIMVFVGFAGAAFYFTFQTDMNPLSTLDDQNYNDSISNKIDEYIWKKYRDQEKREIAPIASEKKTKIGYCYEVAYFNQIESLGQLRTSFIEGHKFFSALHKIHSSARHDQKTDILIDKLQKLLEYNDPYTPKDIQLRFSLLRKEISKKLYIEDTKNSFLFRSLAKVITIQKLGDNALADGGTNATLERTSRLLQSGNINGAYEEMHNHLGTYQAMAEGWVMYVKRYLDMKNYIAQLGDYITSEGYAAKYYKECR